MDIYLSSSIRDGLDGVWMGLADLDLARDESGQGGADGPRRPRGQLLVHLLLVGTRRQGRRVQRQRRLHQQRWRRARQSQVPFISIKM